MIIVRTPVRIPLGGGGTDLPSYYSLYQGEWLSAAITKYIYIVLHKRFDNTLKMSYSKTDEVTDIELIRHPIIKEALRLLDIRGGIEVASFADVPSNTGLGTSGSFTVALLTALHAYLQKEKSKDMPSKKEIAEQACHIAMNILKEPSGKQDEYIAALGGINSFLALQSGEVMIDPIFPQKVSKEKISDLGNNLLMFYTGIKRDSKDILQPHAEAAQKNESQITENLHKIKEIGKEIKKALMEGNLRRFGELMDVHWQEKIKRQGTSNPQINGWYQKAREAGAIGGKLMGAGGGGFFLFYCEGNKDFLRRAMAREGLKEELFRFDFEGAKVMADFI
ncbi:MAG: galactokinase [Patescibacteria group bacterium]